MARRSPVGGSVRPWGSTAALLAASAATLLGIIRGLDPSVILVRAAIVAGITGCIVAVTSVVWSRLSQPR